MKLTVVDEPRMEPLSSAAAIIEVARSAWRKARTEQIALLADQHLLKQLYSPDLVTYVRLKQARTEARKQLAHAQAVTDALEAAITAFEATRPTGKP